MRHREEKQVQPGAINEPTSLENLHSMGLIYGKIFLVDEWVRTWDMGPSKSTPSTSRQEACSSFPAKDM